MTRKADRDQIRRQNRSIVLQALRRGGSMARIDLGQITRLSPATVTAITSDLLDQGLILSLESEEPKTPQARGRPRTLLKLNPDAAFIIGARLSVNNIDLSLVDFAGEVVRDNRTKFDSAAADASSFPEILITAISNFLKEAGVQRGRVQEIGIAAQGVVETETGQVAWSPAFAGRKIPIVSPLQDAFGAQCYISNDTNMITEALHWSDPNRYSGTFAVIMLDYGVGMGLYLNNQLFSGASGTAAEFGHANHIPGGALCRCGKRGCLEAYLSDYALVRAATHLPEDTDPMTIRAGVRGLAQLLEKAASGDENALKAFHEAGRVLGYGVARVIAMIDPKRLVLTGAAMRAFSFMEKGMQDGLEEALVADLRNNFSLDVMPWNEDFIRSGLIAQSMERLDKDFLGAAERTAEDAPRRDNAEMPA
ncbi:putative NBD/HSP70 family sugar kinase [Labrenzia sp. EL_208]|uniref:ROK family protein n=2 Tax=Roseibium album TaxID=311410 RepID=UPI000CF137A5|nr:ROK family protein [Roseibium album]MBG6147676.1 putative NBD/HSP70 family sugar kinase [Labrenzia sp. EL_142]MBG6154036.1 putative NBD/HSP70 family sugar kinase [Labrenzia sp. EL_162]MBG6174893.1 putative NBD/HSP70 family sugar kinase [Labrenzia sp. EL_132]MBG6193835.1 putative NBD/HSP70 family sugar kinase [Labrenzia sp. EL_159]MBG6229505.1 putative NBD/HSP70 family sugar kinase [Labrenzia sp. EL_208]MCR9056226.1 ROK family protein [Paracoccaceae bacterium]